MNWSQFKDDQILKSEIDHRSVIWDEDQEEWIIDYSDISKSEILSKKETPVLTDVCKFVDALILKRRGKISAKYINHISFNLFYRESFFDNDETEESRALIFNFYTLVRKSLAKKTTWLGFASLLDLISGPSDENYFFSDIDDLRYLKLLKFEIQEFVNTVFLALTIEATDCKDHNSIFSNLVLFSNEELILKFQQIRGKGQAQIKFNFLIQLREQLNTNNFSEFFIHLKKPGELVSSPREYLPLLQWIDITLIEIRPSLFYLNIRTDTQKESLRTFFQNQVDQEVIVINDNDSINEDIDLLVSSRIRKTSTSNSKKIPSSIDFDLKPGAKGKASQIISKLFTLIQSFNAGNSIQDIQFWIFQLFINCRDRGFSFSHIKKITESQKTHRTLTAAN